MSFFNNAYTVFLQIIMLAFIVIVGVLGEKIGYFKEKTARLTNDLLFYIITPAVIIRAFSQVEFTPKNALGFLYAFLITSVFHVVAIIVTSVLYKNCERERAVVYRFATIYANMGYMGLPLCAAVMGDIGVFYCSAAVAAFNMFSFTHGVWLMSANGEKFNFKKLILNPGSIGILIGLPVFLLGLKLPEIINTPLSHIASMNTPLAMVMFGTYLAKADFKSVFKQGSIYVTALFKLVILPVIMIMGMHFLGVQKDLLVTASIFISAPTANNTVMFAAKFNKDTSLASQIAGFVSILSVVTMPVCIALAMSL